MEKIRAAIEAEREEDWSFLGFHRSGAAVFESDSQHVWERWVEVAPTERVREWAETLTQRYATRSADALQLAAALVWSGERPRQRPFVCFDRWLVEAAEREGFRIEAV